MKKYYDVLVNFDEYLFYSYEWNKYDNINCLKVVPIIKVDDKTFKDILLNRVILKEDIKGDTIDNKCNKLNCLIVSNGINSIVLDFDNSGKEIGISSLYEDVEIDINSYLKSDSVYKLDYKTYSKRIINKYSRNDIYVSNLIKVELNELYKSRSIDKLLLYYKEVFNNNCNNIDECYKRLVSYVNNGMNKKLYDLYEIIKLVHKKSNHN